MDQIDSYTEQIKIAFKVDKSSADSVGRTIDQFKKKSQVPVSAQSRRDGSALQSWWKSLDPKKMFDASLQGVGKWFFSELKQTFSDAWDELGSILDYSLLSNSQTRQTMLKYGLSSSEAYAFEQTKNLLGINSDEDLFWMNSKQREKFVEKFSEYTERYQKLYDSGFFEKYQELQWEMKEFQEDITYEAMEFIIQNKELIKGFLQFQLDAAKYIIQFIDWVKTPLVGAGSQSFDQKMNYARTVAGQTITVTSNVTNNYQDGTSTSSSGSGSSMFKTVMNQILALGGR